MAWCSRGPRQQCAQADQVVGSRREGDHPVAAPAATALVAEPLADLVLRLTGLDVSRCAICGIGRMLRTAIQAPRRWAPIRPALEDTS